VVIALLQTITSGHWAALQHPVVHMPSTHGAQQVVTVYFSGYCGTNMNHKKSTGKKMVKAITGTL
jgi:hypothetical protein